MEKRTKVACRNKGCNFFGYAAFDDRCPDCATSFGSAGNGGGGGIMDAVVGTEAGTQLETAPHCSACEALVEEGNSFCTSCGAQFSESTEDTVAESTHCFSCGIDVQISEEESSCPRCSAPIVEAKADDDEDDEEDDEDDEDDEKGDDDEDDEDEDGKKILLDKGRRGKKCEDVAPLSPREEARVLIDLAVGLDEHGRQDLAAHIVWGEANNRDIEDGEEIDRPRWVPEEHDDDWKKAQSMGRSKTFMGQVHVFQGLVARR